MICVPDFKGIGMKNIIFALVFSACAPKTPLPSSFVITPKHCGGCLEKGGTVVVSHKDIDIIYHCPKLLADHKSIVTYDIKTQLKYLNALDCKPIGSNPPWRYKKSD